MKIRGTTITTPVKPEAVVDDKNICQKPWSSKNTVDKLCPSFTESGAVVQCQPLEGYPLEVVSTINDKGDYWESITLTRCGKNLFDFTVDAYQLSWQRSDGTERKYVGYAIKLPAGTYTLHSEKKSSTTATEYYLGSIVVGADGVEKNNADTGAGTVYWGGENARYVRTITIADGDVLCVYNGNSTTVSPGTLKIFTYENIQIEAGSVKTDYEPYRGQTLTADFADLDEAHVLFGSYNWQTGVLDTGDDGYYQHDPATDTFTYIENIDLYVPPTVRNIPAVAGTNYLYSDCGDTQVSGKSDPVAIIEKQETIIAEQEAELAKLNKQYELIEEVTIEEDTTSFLRKVDPNGNSYNFSAVRIYVEAQPCTTASSSSQVIFSVGTMSQATYIYHQVSNGLNTTARVTGFIARNDCGFVEYHSINSSSGASFGSVQSKPFYDTVLPWVNIERIELQCYPSAAYIPAGTKITIYGIRG